MAIDFPASPTLNDVFTVGNVTYVWDGTKWTASVTGGISLDKIEEGNTSAEVIDTGSDGRFVVTTEGTGRLFVDASGQVSIGSSASGSPLNVSEQGVSGAPVIRFIGNAGNGNYMRGGWFASDNTTQLAQLSVDGTVAMYVGTISSTPVLLTTNNTERLRITSAGLVGIGTSAPDAALHVVGSAILTGAVSVGTTASATSLQFPAVTGWGPRIQQGGASINDFGIFTNNTENLTVKNSGNVGIGTSVPSARFQVESTAANTLALFTNPGVATVYIGISGQSENYYDANTQIFRSGNTTERMRIDSSGRLLVGTSSSPSLTDGQYAKIHLVGNTAGATGDSVLNLGRGILASSGIAADTNLGILQFTDSAGAAHATIKGVTDAATGSNDYPGRLVFSTTADGASAPTERMRIEQSGNIRFMNTGLVFPLTDNAVSLGLNGYRWTEVWAANGTIQTSDQRAKTDITSATLGSDFVKSLRPVSYRWVEGGKVDSGNRDEDGNYIYESVPGTRTHWGFIAQEVKQAVDATGVDFGGWLLTDKDDPDSQQALRYDQFIAPLTKALQEAIAKIETLEGMVAVNNITIDEQQHQLSTLAARLTALETP
jgi:hypothetical protein